MTADFRGVPRLDNERYANLTAALAELEGCLISRPDADLSTTHDYHEELACALAELGLALRAAGLCNLPDEWDTRPGPGSYARNLLQYARDPTGAIVAKLLGQDARNPAFFDAMRAHIAMWANALRDATQPVLPAIGAGPPPAVPAPSPNGTQQGEGGTPTAVILPALLSASDIAKRIKRNVKSVTSFLTRFAEKNADCRIVNASKRKNEPGYLYRTADVWSALEKWMKDNANQ